jgi:alpha-ribazole phosphatase
MDGLLCLVRHTRTAIAEGICYGQTDTDVADTFDSEYPAVVSQLTGLDFDLVYSSPLKRCLRLAELFSSNVLPDSRLLEMNFGIWEGVRWDEIFRSPDGQKWFSAYTSRRCPGGESFIDLQKRAWSFLQDIDGKGKRILAVTHAGLTRAMLVRLGLEKADIVFGKKIPFGGVVILDRTDSSYTCRQPLCMR